MGDRIKLINTIYFPQKYGKGNKFNDKLIKILRNEETGEKYFELVSDPKMLYFINKPEHYQEIPTAHIEPEKVNFVEVNNRDLLKSVANELDELESRVYEEEVNYNTSFFYDCLKSGNAGHARKLHLDPNVHRSDMNIEDYYISKHMLDNPMEESDYKPTKAYFDIEVDGIDVDGFPEESKAEAPVNAITHWDRESETSFTLLLRHASRPNPQIPEFEKNIDEFNKRMNKKYKDQYGLDITFKTKFYDDEVELIKDYFNIVNITKPDFNNAWNMKFDILTLINRAKNQGGIEADELVSHPDMPYKMAYYYDDDYNNKFTDKGDYFKCASYTQYNDLLLLYANLRKVSGQKESYKLDAIVEEEINEQKLPIDPNNEGIDIKNFPYKNYERFVEYNIHDVMLLGLLEDNNEDIETLDMIASMTNTRNIKALKKTICLKNLAIKYYFQQDYILSNNRNKNYGGVRPISGKFRGAYVANPKLNKNVGVKINGKNSKFVFDLVIDMDLSSLYPSILSAFNIDITTQRGKIILYDSLELENKKNDIIELLDEKQIFLDDIDKYGIGSDLWIEACKKEYPDVYRKIRKEGLLSEDKGYDFVDKLSSRDYISLGKEYFNLPNLKEMIELVS